jgi:ADP-ribosyl-[dinitrogen reductase] hydrolase
MSNVLLGGAIGDSLGMFAEKRTADDSLLVNWDGKTFLPSEYHKLNAGQWTDDTQLSIIVAESLIKNHGFNPTSISEDYLRWFDSGKARGYGKTTKLAIDNLRDGKKYYESGIVDSYGNGTAMRAAPFGVYYKDDIKFLIESIKTDSAITHASNEAEAGALAVGLAVAYCLNKQSENLIANIIEYLPDSKVRESLLGIEELVNSDVSVDKAYILLGTKADVRMTIPSVFFTFLKFNSFKEGITKLIKAGGDTDTNAAILGSLYASNNIFDINDYVLDSLEDYKYIKELDYRLLNKEIFFFPR